jgi:GNAT superfamily N-acetyltransferase
MPRAATRTTASPVTIRLQRKAARKDLQFVWNGLSRFNRQVVGRHPHAHFLVEARSASGVLLGGLQGVLYYQWLFVANFYLSARIRRGGTGTQMLAEAERYARSLGCRGVWLDTFSWQARPFYEKQGYKLFGTLPDYPDGRPRYFMMKMLAPDAPKPKKATGRRQPPAPRTKTRRA